jgi:hypothetical protein
MGSPQAQDKISLDAFFSRLQGSAASNNPPINFETLYEEIAGKDDSPLEKPAASKTPFGPSQPSTTSTIPMQSLTSFQGHHQTQCIAVDRDNPSGRPRVLRVENPSGSDDPALLDIDAHKKCQVLVEFKRKRVLQFESTEYVGPGEYVVVGGDRGEDIGLVIYSWCETKSGGVTGVGLRGSSLTRSVGIGTGTLLRFATSEEVQQLHGAQQELERRAVDICQMRVLDRGLPMVIVDAEYQFDKKKLTFFYEAQQRMDFRELVRDLFKTFRARIWMELVEI